MISILKLVGQRLLMLAALVISGTVASADIIIDNTDTSGVTITGAWSASTATPGFYGSNYLSDGNTGRGTKNVTYTPTIPSAGGYQVYARWTAAANRSSNTLINIVAGGTTYPVHVNQQTLSGQWNLLGTYTFAAGTGGYAQISNTGANGYVIADAVKFVPTSVTAIPVNDFLNTMGIQTHIQQGYSWSSYTTPLQYTGIRNIRDASNAGNATPYINLHNATGVMVDVTSGNALTLTTVNALAAANALLAIEGPNESNNFPLTVNGHTGGGTALPTGLAVNTTTGVISGTPSVTGTYDVALTATNASGTARATMSIAISPAAGVPIITSAAEAVATSGSFSYAITASNNPTSYNATFLPPGLSVNTSTGVISGVTTATAGTWTATLSATNATGTTTCPLTIAVNPPTGAPVITSPAMVLGASGSALSYPITASHSPTKYGATPSFVTIAQYQRDLFASISASSTLQNYPVFAPSEGGGESDNAGLQWLTIASGAGCELPDGTGLADFANAHNYVCGTGTHAIADNQAWNAEDPTLNSHWDGLYCEYGVTWNKSYAGYPTAQLPSLPRVTTETGWPTGGTNPTTEEQQGKLYLNLFLTAVKRGWTFTSIYQMRDGEGGDGVDFGIYHTDYTPKLAATDIHNFTTILADTTAVTPGFLAYTITSEPVTVHDLLLQKSDGTFWLAVWDDRPVAEGSDNIAVSLGQTVTSVAEYDPTVGTTATTTLSSVSSVPLTLTDHPVLLHITP